MSAGLSKLHEAVCGIGSMRIQIDPHTLERAEERGANIEEITDAIKMGFPSLPRKTDWQKQKSFLLIGNGSENSTSRNGLK
jgi:hypothetical protein